MSEQIKDQVLRAFPTTSTHSTSKTHSTSFPHTHFSFEIIEKVVENPFVEDEPCENELRILFPFPLAT